MNLFYRHRIPLAETDPVDPRPVLNGPFRVRCDECGQRVSLQASEVLRFEQELPENFTPIRYFEIFKLVAGAGRFRSFFIFWRNTGTPPRGRTSLRRDLPSDQLRPFGSARSIAA